MKKCPKCNRVYDDSWGVCLACRKPLLQDMQSSSTTKEEKAQLINIDRDKLAKARKALKRDLIIFISCWASLFILPVLTAIRNNFLQNTLVILGLVVVLTFFILRFVIIFRIRYVCVPMGKSRTYITIFQLAAFLIPLGGIVFPLIVLEESKTLLQKT